MEWCVVVDSLVEYNQLVWILSFYPHIHLITKFYFYYSFCTYNIEVGVRVYNIVLYTACYLDRFFLLSPFTVFPNVGWLTTPDCLQFKHIIDFG